MELMNSCESLDFSQIAIVSDRNHPGELREQTDSKAAEAGALA